MQYMDFSTANSEEIAAALGARLEEIRLSRNISQADLAKEAGVSRSTITRLATPGKGVSLDSFIRLMLALGLGDQLAGLLPDPRIRPVERARFRGSERRRARGQRTAPAPWQWGEESPES